MSDQIDPHFELTREKHLNAVLRAIRNVSHLIATEDDPGRMVKEACALLTATRGYFNAWIVLTGRDGSVTYVVGAGEEESDAFPGFLATIERGELPQCVRGMMSAEKVVSVIHDPARECDSCPMASRYVGRAGLSAVLRYRGRVMGALTVSVPAEFATDSEETALLGEVAGDIAFALHSIEFRERAESVLAASEERVRSILEGLPIGVLIHLDLHIVYANREALRIFRGRSDEEVIGRKIWDFIDPEKRDTIQGRIDAALDSDQPLPLIEQNVRRLDGTVARLLFTARRFFVDDRPAVLSSFSDLTPFRQVQSERDESRALYAVLVDSAPVGIAVHQDGKFVFVNDEGARIWGASAPSDLVGRSIWDIVPEDLREELAAVVDKRLETSGSNVIETRHRRLDGEEFAIRIHGRRVSYDGRPAIQVIFQDISESQRIDRALRESEARLRSIMENAPVPIFLKDLDGRLLTSNRAHQESHGLDLDEVIGKTSFEYDPEPIAKRNLVQERMVIESGKALTFENKRSIRETGERTSMTVRFPIIDECGNLIGTGGLDINVTEQQQAEHALRKSESRFSKAFQASPVPQAITGISDGRFFDVNERWESLMGYSRDEAVGKTVEELGVWVDLEQRKGLVDQLREDGYIHDFQASLKTKSGDVRQMVLDGHLIEVDGEDRILFVSRDVTDHIRLEEQLRQAQKMEVVGQLTGGVAHDFNNLLQVIQTNLELARAEISEQREVKELLDTAYRAGRRGARLTQQLLAFSRKQTLRPKVLDLNDLVDGMIKLMTRTLGEDVAIRTNLARDVGNVLADEHGLTNALLNIVVNARAAMPKGGTLSITSRRLNLETEVPIDNGILPVGDYIEIAVVDTGCGMSEDVATRAFEPFFTTKNVGEGSGLGLSMAYGFARQSGGNVTIESTVDTGTTVRILLPAAGERPTANDRPAASASSGDLHIKVLLVEDDKHVRRATAMLLRRLGCEVREAESAASVLETLEGGSEIDLLLSDIMLPDGMNGVELAEAAARVRPSIKVLLVSGYPEAALGKVGLNEVRFRLLGKPFSRNVLAETLRAVMGD